MTKSSPDVRTRLLAVMPRLRRYLLVVTGSLAAADELLAEACEHIVAGKCGPLPDEDAEQRLFTQATMIWEDKLVSIYSGQITPAFPSSGDAGAKCRSDKIEASELPALQAISELVPEQRAILALVCIEGFSYIEAAGILGIPIEALKNGLIEARLAIAREVLCESDYARSVIENGDLDNSPIGQTDQRPASKSSSVSTPLPGSSGVGLFFRSQPQQ